MATIIAHTAVVDPRAELDEEVRIGHHCVIGPNVRVGRGTRLENNVTLTGNTTIGRNNHLFPGVVIGAEPQDLSYQGSPTQVIIGDNNVFRESVTINRATEKEDGITSLGSNCYLMTCSHVAHDCKVGDRVIMANNVMLGGLSRVIHDVPPYMLVEGFPARPRTINIVALKRKNFTADAIKALMEAYRLLYRSRVGMEHAREILAGGAPMMPELQVLFDFIQDSQDGRHGRGRDRRKAA